MESETSRRDFLIGTASMAAAICSSEIFAAHFIEVEKSLSLTQQKKMLGQFFTEGECWLRPQVIDFIRKTHCSTAYDPFAGTGCLFEPVKKAVPNIDKCIGLDIDASLGWTVNDSLVHIPHEEDAVIVTNPPYISNYSASRKKKKIDAGLKKYFDSTDYDDVYLLALDKMLEAQRNVVAIVPETFINLPYKQKDLLSSITILEDNPFLDTDTPVVVVCFDSKQKDFSEVKIYKDEKYICSLKDVEDSRLIPDNSVVMKFNDIKGWLGVRCVDSTDPNERLHFDFKENINYDWNKGIKVSSRLMTLISIDVPVSKRKTFVAECNRILYDIRVRSQDIILSPFKGNTKAGVRRRRLDFMTCRAIVEMSYKKLHKQSSVEQIEFKGIKK